MIINTRRIFRSMTTNHNNRMRLQKMFTNTRYFCKNSFLLKPTRTFAKVRRAEFGLRGVIVAIL